MNAEKPQGPERSRSPKKSKNRLFYINSIGSIGIILFIFLLPDILTAQPLFIFRPRQPIKPLWETSRLTLRGEFFASLLLPSNFPSFNDLTGNEDRWNFGFQNFLDLTASTHLLAQLVTHDDGQNRTKFDWHFSLRQEIGRHFFLLAGHDSNHDSDHQSIFNGRPYYLNRNYIGFGLIFASSHLLFEPFTWFFHHTNQRSHLDFSGEKLEQEYGFRLGISLTPELTLSFQAIFQSDVILARGQSLLADLILRLQLARWLEISGGASFWRDISASRLGNQESFYKIIWGMAIPF